MITLRWLKKKVMMKQKQINTIKDAIPMKMFIEVIIEDQLQYHTAIDLPRKSSFAKQEVSMNGDGNIKLTIINMIIRSSLSLIRKSKQFFSQAIPLKIIERPYTPQHWNKMWMAQISTVDRTSLLDHLFHSINLMQHEITPFNYDLFQWMCWKAVENQQQLNKQQIFSLLKLSLKYKIRMEPFHVHMENQLYLRVHRDYQGDIQDYDDQLGKQFKAMYAELEKNSMDYFQLIKEQEKKEEEIEEDDQADKEKESTEVKEEVSEDSEFIKAKQAFLAPKKIEEVITEDEKLIHQMSKKLRKASRKSKQFSIQQVAYILQLLRLGGSKNLSFIQYLLQLLTTKYESNPNILSIQMTSYLQGLTFACSSLMNQYFTNKQKYTTRSIKRIYQYQSFYYIQHLRQLEQIKSNLSNQEIQELIEIYKSFPIKKRSIRRSIGAIIGNEMINRNLVDDSNLIKSLLAINKKDEKMKILYCNLLKIETPKAIQCGYIHQPVLKPKKQKKTSSQPLLEGQNPQNQSISGSS